MNGTFFSLDLLNTPLGFLVAGLVGLLFGFFLEQAGFGSSRKLTGMFYFKDMAVLKVMFTAVVVALVGYRYLTTLGWLRAADVYIMPTYWGAAIVGGIIFGVGFVMGGWCPGTAIVGLACAKLDALVFLVGAVLGGIFFNEIYGVVEPLYNGLCAGVVTLSDTLGLPMNVLVLALCGIAVLLFAGSAWVETRFGGVPRPDAATRRRRRWAAGTILVLAICLFFVPERPSEPVAAAAAAQPETFLESIVAGEDHIDPLDAAPLMMASAPELLVVDIRPAADFALFHLRGAVNIPLEQMPARLSELREGKTVILYSNGTTHSAQAWLALRQLGIANALVLTDGLVGFWRDCLTPPSLGELPVDEQRARALYEEYAKRKAWFIDQATEVKPDAVVADMAAAMPEPGVAKHLVSTGWLASVAGDRRIKILDVRPGDYFTGKTSDEARAGHIPGAVNREYTLDLVPESELWQSADRLKDAYASLGIITNTPVIVHCRTGHQASQTYFLLKHLLGFQNVRWFDASWSAWAAGKDLPVEQ